MADSSLVVGQVALTATRSAACLPSQSFCDCEAMGCDVNKGVYKASTNINTQCFDSVVFVCVCARARVCVTVVVVVVVVVVLCGFVVCARARACVCKWMRMFCMSVCARACVRSRACLCV